MINPYFHSLKENMSFILLIGFAFMTASQSYSVGTPQHMFNGNAFSHQAMAQQQQQHYANSPPVNKSSDHQNKPGNTIKASGHFANNQLKGGVVTWIQGGYWNLQIDTPNSNDSNQTSGNADKNHNTAMFMANFTMIKPDGSLSHSHTINNFSSSNAIVSDNDLVVTGMADIHSDNGLEYKQVPLIVHLMGKKVLGLTIDVGKTGGHFAGQNEMFGTLISGVGINVSNATTTTMNHGEPIPNETHMAMPMQH
jgi:hypothetical protein